MTQSPEHTVQVGGVLMIDGDPFTIRAVKPVRESGVFVDFGQKVEQNIVIVTVERFDGNPR